LKNVGLIGCGTIGCEIARSIDNQKIPSAKLSFMVDTSTDRLRFVNSTLRNEKPIIFSDPESLFRSDVYKGTHIVVESASRAAVRQYARKILSSGKHLIIFSIGELIDEKFMKELKSLAVVNAAVIHIPTGAIAGIDAIKAVRSHLDRLVISTTKSPKSLAGAPFFKMHRDIILSNLSVRTVLYEGSVQEAIELFPSNVNVSAALALAIGDIDKILVRILVDPSIDVNRHEIVASGKFGVLQITANNTPHVDNPKTSMLAVLSGIESVRSACSGTIRIGS
jgi:aspartate dehydrogenase